MPFKTVRLFVNPTAGRGRTARRIDRISHEFVRANIAVRVNESRGVGDLENLVCRAANEDDRSIIVAGGDGSIHEAVNGILRAGSNRALGIVPCGTGNDFAKACGIPLDWREAARQLVDRIVTNAPPKSVDVGRMNDRYFANGAGIGFDAKVTHVAQSYRWPIGDFVYLFAILRCLVDGIATPGLRITADAHNFVGPVTLANVSNGPWIGGMFRIAPKASNSDGMLDLLIADPVSRKRLLALLPKLIRGKHADEPEVVYRPVRKVRIHSAVPVPSHLDGEVQPLGRDFEIEVLPGALQIL